MADGTPLRTGEVAERLKVSESTVIKWEAEGLLRSTRTVGRHRRLDPESVAELQKVLSLPLGPERDAALAALARRNLGLPDPD